MHVYICMLNHIYSISVDCDEAGAAQQGRLSAEELELLFTSYDLKRLEAYASNIVDHHIIMVLNLLALLVQKYEY